MKRTTISGIYKALYELYGPQDWWPGETEVEIIIGAVLTQNTAWQNVAMAIANLKENKLRDAQALLQAEPERVKSLIKPSGFFNVKYKRLRNVAKYFVEAGIDFERFRSLPVAQLREELLAINGIGPETADSILLYAFQRPIFVIDMYSRRLFSRLGYGFMETCTYERAQKLFMDNLPPDHRIYNEYHALIVMHCKSVCKKKPRCPECKLRSLCPAAPPVGRQ